MQVFLDLDGVLVDLEAQARAHFNECRLKEMIDYSTGCEQWRNLGEAFWAFAPWTPDGRLILEIIEKIVGRENVVLCTRCPQCPQAAAGKMRWIMEQMDPHYGDTHMFVREKWRIQGGGAAISRTFPAGCSPDLKRPARARNVVVYRF